MLGVNKTAKLEEQVATQGKEPEEQLEPFLEQEVTQTEDSVAIDAIEVNMAEGERIAVKESTERDESGGKQESVVSGDEPPVGSQVVENQAVHAGNEHEIEQAQEEKSLLASTVAASSGDHSSVEEDLSTEKHNKAAPADTNLNGGYPDVKVGTSTCDSPAAVKDVKIEATHVNSSSSGTANSSAAVSGNNNSAQSVDLLPNGTSIGMPLNTTSNQSLPSGVQNDSDTVERTVVASENRTALDVNSVANGSATLPILSQQANQKESVFIRLGNKIKNLEANLTLISHYLEELGLK